MSNGNAKSPATWAAEKRAKKRTGPAPKSSGPTQIGPYSEIGLTTGNPNIVVVSGVSADYSQMVVAHRAVGPFGNREDITADDWVLSNAQTYRSYEAHRTSGDEPLIKKRRDDFVSASLEGLGLLKGGAYPDDSEARENLARLQNTSPSQKDEIIRQAATKPKGKVPEGGINRQQALNRASKEVSDEIQEGRMASWKLEVERHKAAGTKPPKQPSGKPQGSKEQIWEKFQLLYPEYRQVESMIREVEENVRAVAREEISSPPYENVGGSEMVRQIPIPELRGRDGVHVLSALMKRLKAVSDPTPLTGAGVARSPSKK